MKMKCEGTVISVDGAKAKVTVTTTSECMGCSSKSHCHSGLTGSREITVINECGAKVSDNIIFETTAGKFIVSAALIWILPCRWFLANWCGICFSCTGVCRLEGFR